MKNGGIEVIKHIKMHLGVQGPILCDDITSCKPKGSTRKIKQRRRKKNWEIQWKLSPHFVKIECQYITVNQDISWLCVSTMFTCVRQHSQLRSKIVGSRSATEGRIQCTFVWIMHKQVHGCWGQRWARVPTACSLKYTVQMQHERGGE